MIDLTFSIQTELQEIIQAFVLNGKLDTQNARMIFIRFSESFNHLLVYTHDC